GDQFWKSFECVLCVDPELLPGSNVPSDHLVRVLGFENLVDFLCKTTRNPGWSKNQWISFAMSLGLVLRADDEPAARSARENRLIVEEYRRRCEVYLSQDLPNLVATTVQGPETKMET